MKSWLALFLATAITGCAPPGQREHTQIMDAIEHRVQLPPGAAPLAEYARAYAYAPGGRVIAHYFQPDGHFLAEPCNGAKRHGPGNGQIAMLCPPPDGMESGERRWYEDYKMLPDATDGGCDLIDFEFDSQTMIVRDIRCHGEG